VRALACVRVTMGKAGKRGSTGDGAGDGDDGTSLTPFKVYASEVRRQAGAKAKDSGFTSSDLKVHSPQSCARVLLLLAARSAENELAGGGQLHVTHPAVRASLLATTPPPAVRFTTRDERASCEVMGLTGGSLLCQRATRQRTTTCSPACSSARAHLRCVALLRFVLTCVALCCCSVTLLPGKMEDAAQARATQVQDTGGGNEAQGCPCRGQAQGSQEGLLRSPCGSHKRSIEARECKSCRRRRSRQR
jgi:hypothetical protein